MVGLLSACREEPQLLDIYKSYDPLVHEIEQGKIYSQILNVNVNKSSITADHDKTKKLLHKADFGRQLLNSDLQYIKRFLDGKSMARKIPKLNY